MMMYGDDDDGDDGDDGDEASGPGVASALEQKAGEQKEAEERRAEKKAAEGPEAQVKGPLACFRNMHMHMRVHAHVLILDVPMHVYARTHAGTMMRIFAHSNIRTHLMCMLAYTRVC